MEPILSAIGDTLRAQAQLFTNAIHGLSHEALHWTPGPNTNSIASLTKHAWTDVRRLVGTGAGIEVERDRPSEFRASDLDVGAHEQMVQQGLAEAIKLLSSVEPDTYDIQAMVAGEPVPLTRGHFLIVAIQHTQEHLAQVLLTRQLWEAKHGQETPENVDGYRV